MLSSIARRTMASKTIIRPVIPISYRCYTIIPSIPQAKQPQQPTIMAEEEHPNPIHALYNDTESMVDSTTSSHLHSAPQHNIASDVFGSSSTDTFSPTFNTVFDE